jgi:hypothetical protein
MLMETYKELKELILRMEKDLNKVFLKKNRIPAVRARKDLQKIKDLSKKLRGEIQEHLKVFEGDEF